jgi:ATP-dependent Clp protease adaptor protein ClpS
MGIPSWLQQPRHAGLQSSEASLVSANRDGRTIGLVTTRPSPVITPDTSEKTDLDRPWQVIVWNDPVNTMAYVVYVFRKLFGYDTEKATRLMLQVHFDGRARVSDGPREKAEIDCYRLHGHGLWATMEQ